MRLIQISQFFWGEKRLQKACAVVGIKKIRTAFWMLIIQIHNTLFVGTIVLFFTRFHLEEKINQKLPEIWSCPSLPGTVQLTPDGTLILLMRDAQITGGYPRILQLSDDAINLLAQKTTKDQIKFEIKALH